MKRIEVVAGIIKDNNKIFATQRGYGEFEGGWEFGEYLCKKWKIGDKENKK